MANRLTEGRWTWPDHLDLLSRKLVHASCGRCARLIVTMPPQNGKSSLVAHWFPVWHLDRHPDHRIVYVSYAADYAHQWGRAVRNSIAEHTEVLRCRLSDDSAAVSDWQTTAGGGMVSVGVGGAVTGRRANVLIFDDPLKGPEEANSETIRAKVWEFFRSVAYTRLTPDGIIIIVTTRWHEDDLVGRIGAQGGDGEAWDTVDLPAVAKDADALGRKPGEPLWPQRWPLPALDRIRRAIGSYFWAALYQQAPAAAEGNYFKGHWFGIPVERDRVPKLVDTVRCWDLAATEAEAGGDPDWLAGVKMGRTADTEYFVLDVIRERLSPEGVEKTIRQTAAVDGKGVKIRIEQEGAASGKLTRHHFLRMLDGYDARFTGIPRNSKLTRAGAYNAACEREAVKLVRGDWVEQFIHEHKQFPTGRHDDVVDGSVGAYESLTAGVRQFNPEDWKKVVSYAQ